MTFGNLIPFVLAYKYPQIVAIGYPLVVFGISMMAALYVVSQTKKTGITAIDPEMLSKKESKTATFSGSKSGSDLWNGHVLWNTASECPNR